AERYFLVTASHALPDNLKQPTGLVLFNPTGHENGATQLRDVPLAGNVIRAREPWDLAVVELSERTVAALSNRRFLRLHDVQLRATQRGWYYVYGFPISESNFIPGTKTYSFRGFILSAPRFSTDAALRNFEPDKHFLLDATREELYSPDGTPAHLPRSLRGISGCSVWQTLRPGESPFDGWDPGNIRIAGVQVGTYDEPSSVKGIHRAAVANMLYQSYPDPQPSLIMHLGPPN